MVFIIINIRSLFWISNFLNCSIYSICVCRISKCLCASKSLLFDFNEIAMNVKICCFTEFIIVSGSAWCMDRYYFKTSFEIHRPTCSFLNKWIVLFLFKLFRKLVWGTMTVWGYWYKKKSVCNYWVLAQYQYPIVAVGRYVHTVAALGVPF